MSLRRENHAGCWRMFETHSTDVHGEKHAAMRPHFNHSPTDETLLLNCRFTATDTRFLAVTHKNTHKDEEHW